MMAYWRNANLDSVVVVAAVTLVTILFLAAGAIAADAPEQFKVWGKNARADKYMGDPGLDTPGKADVEATPVEKERGFLVFAKPACEIIKPDYIPKAGERSTALQAKDCRGQYGPITFWVFAIAGNEFSLKVTDLTGPGGKKIAKENFDVRVVRYAKIAAKGKEETIPLTIEAFDKKKLAAKRLGQFWITYYVPKDATPGEYTGEVQVFAGGQKTVSLPLTLGVYGFDLVEPDLDMYFYYMGRADPAKTDPLVKHLVDQRCHGMNTGMVIPPVDYHKNDLKRQELLPLLDAYKKAGFTHNAVRIGLGDAITSEWINTPDKSIKMWGPWFRYYPFSKELDDKYISAVKFIDGELKKRGLKMILAVADEAGSHAWTIPAAQHYNELVKRELPGVTRELTCGGGWASGEAEHELWKGLIDIWTTNRWLPDKLDIVRRDDPKAKIGIYNMCGPGSGPGGVGSARNVYGFFAWKAKADAVSQWVYYFDEQPDEIYVRPAQDPEDGMVPTLRWEAVREGAKDRRYLATLEKLLVGKKGPTADEAAKFLTEIAGKIELKNVDYDPINGGRVLAQLPGTYDQWRAKIAELAEKLTQGTNP